MSPMPYAIASSQSFTFPGKISHFFISSPFSHSLNLPVLISRKSKQSLSRLVTISNNDVGIECNLVCAVRKPFQFPDGFFYLFFQAILLPLPFHYRGNNYVVSPCAAPLTSFPFCFHKNLVPHPFPVSTRRDCGGASLEENIMVFCVYVFLQGTL